MKKIKILLWLIILLILGLLFYQNYDYFMHKQALTFDLKIFSWTLPKLQTGIYLAICFFVGLLLIGIKLMTTNFRSKKQIKTLNQTIEDLNKEVNTLRSELGTFQNDPYIKKELENRKQAEEKTEESEKNDAEEKQ